ncbi:hypothetical protein QOZ80_3AG0251250 [Eleusine coracana subsp. coracana]|nr:hypothetical protein QOZ80_3AG0251250 [Eleusine coracana subsp. coracana]
MVEGEGFVVAADDGAAAIGAPVVNGGPRTPMRWSAANSRFVLRAICELVGQGARIDKGFKEVLVNQVAKALREFSGDEVTATQVYNHLRKWRQRWGKVSKLKDLSGAQWDDDTKSIVLEHEHYLGHIKDHPKDAEYLNRPIEFYTEMETAFGSTMATVRFAMGSGEALGQFSGVDDSEGTKPKMGDIGGHNKAEAADTSKATTEANTGGLKRKRSCFSEHESLLVSNMTDAVNNVVAALRETAPSYIDLDLYDAVMGAPEFSEEALIVAYSHLLDNKAQGRGYINKPCPSA